MLKVRHSIILINVYFGATFSIAFYSIKTWKFPVEDQNVPTIFFIKKKKKQKYGISKLTEFHL